MVPGYFDLGFAVSLGVCFLIGLSIAFLAGRKYRMYDEPPRAGFRASLLSPPVTVFVVLIFVLSIVGYLNYTPKPKGY